MVVGSLCCNIVNVNRYISSQEKPSFSPKCICCSNIVNLARFRFRSTSFELVQSYTITASCSLQCRVAYVKPLRRVLWISLWPHADSGTSVLVPVQGSRGKSNWCSGAPLEMLQSNLITEASQAPQESSAPPATTNEPVAPRRDGRSMSPVY